MSADVQHHTIDPLRYRQVLGQYPTGVSAVTAMRGNAEPVAMIVGSFTSVSLDPPLVAFFPDRASSSWAKLRDCEHFCINILSAEQERLCRILASKSPDKFIGTAHKLSTRGNPVLDGVVAWIECERYSVSDAGDHHMVLGHVRDMKIVTAGLPLLFYQGGYGRFTPTSMVALDAPGLTLEQLRSVDCARPEMEGLSAALSGRCIATVPVGGELAIAASAGRARHEAPGTLVGQLLPNAPPTGSIFAAWLADEQAQKWLGRLRNPDRRQSSRTALRSVRARGYSLGLINDGQRKFSARLEAIAAGQADTAGLEEMIEDLSYDPEILSPAVYTSVRLVTAPVFDRSGQVTLALTLYDFPKPLAPSLVESYITRVVEAAARVTTKLTGEKF